MGAEPRPEKRRSCRRSRKGRCSDGCVDIRQCRAWEPITPTASSRRNSPSCFMISRISCSIICWRIVPSWRQVSSATVFARRLLHQLHRYPLYPTRLERRDTQRRNRRSGLQSCNEGRGVLGHFVLLTWLPFSFGPSLCIVLALIQGSRKKFTARGAERNIFLWFLGGSRH